jgi:hypothetical protein
MDTYIATDLIKYIISDYLPLNFLEYLSHKNVYKHKKYETTISEIYYKNKGSRRKINNLFKDKFMINNQSNVYKICKYAYKNVVIETEFKNDKIMWILKRKDDLILYKHYNFDGTLNYRFRNDGNGTVIIFNYNQGFLHMVWFKNICYHLYRKPYIHKKDVKHWWENYISLEIKYTGIFKDIKEYSKYFNKHGYCKRHKKYIN